MGAGDGRILRSVEAGSRKGTCGGGRLRSVVAYRHRIPEDGRTAQGTGLPDACEGHSGATDNGNEERLNHGCGFHFFRVWIESWAQSINSLSVWGHRAISMPRPLISLNPADSLC